MQQIVRKFRSPISGAHVTLDVDVADMLAAPAPRERELVDAVRKTGGDDARAELAASMFARGIDALADAYGGRLPDEVAKAIRDAAGIPAPVRKATPKPVPPEPQKRTADEVLADVKAFAKSCERMDEMQASWRLEREVRRIRKAHPGTTEAQAYVEALEKDPELYNAARRHELRKQGFLKDGPETLS